MVCCQVFNTDMMDNAAPLYKMYDSPYAKANFLLANEAEPLLAANASAQVAPLLV
jgi:hypothetical protein